MLKKYAGLLGKAGKRLVSAYIWQCIVPWWWNLVEHKLLLYPNYRAGSSTRAESVHFIQS